MIYLIIICIAIYFIMKLYDGFKTVLEYCFDFCRKHVICTAVLIVIFICLICGWNNAAALIGITSILLRVITVRNQASNRKQFIAWLNKNATKLGEISAEAMLESGIVPEQFQEFSYPTDSSAHTIVQEFLNERQRKLELRFQDALYEEIHAAGMTEPESLQATLFPRYERATRLSSLAVVFSKAVTTLEIMGKIDHPIQNSDVLHCIGVTSGSQFDSIEADIGDI